MVNQFKLICACLLGAAPVVASAAPITGSFSLASFGGAYVGGTAATATGLDFGALFGSSGNGYGTQGTALIGNATGSFLGLNGKVASISDISLGAAANPFGTNPFISFGADSPIVLNFSNASFTRSPLGTSLTITGVGMFSDGIAADSSSGIFSFATSSQQGSSSAVDFTFTSNASTTAVPEPAAWAMLVGGFGVVGGMMRRRKVALA